MTQHPITCRFEMKSEMQTRNDYAALGLRVQTPHTPRTIVVLVFKQDGSRGHQYYVATSQEDLEAQVQPCHDEKLIMGSVLHIPYSEWKPFIIASKNTTDIWDVQGGLEFVVGAYYAAWVVSTDIHHPDIIDIRAGWGTYWGHPMVVDKRWTSEQRMYAARQVFGDQYTFIESTGKTMAVTNPDHGWRPPTQGIELLKHPLYLQDRTYMVYQDFLQRLVHESREFEENSDASEILSQHGEETGLHLTMKVLEDSRAWGSLQVTYRLYTDGGVSVYRDGEDGAFNEWLCGHSHLLHDTEALESHVKLRAAMTKWKNLHRAGRDVKLNKCEMLMSVLDHVRAPMSHQSSFPILTSVFPTIQWRPDQTAVIAEVLRRETDTTLSIDHQLYAKIADASDGSDYGLYYSGLFGDYGVRSPSSAPSPLFGGLIVAGLGWGKTLVTFAIVAASERRGHHPTLVICPTQALASQWKMVCDTATTLTSHAHFGKKTKLLSGTKPLPLVDVVFTTHALVRDDSWIQSHEWTRVVYDEAHEFNVATVVLKEAVAKLKTSIQWGLTATPTRAERPSMSGIMQIFLQTVHATPANGWSPSEQAVFLQLFAVSPPSPPSTVQPTWTTIYETMDLPMPPSLKRMYQEVKAVMAQRGWCGSDKYRNTLRKIAAGLTNVSLPPSVMDPFGEGTSDGRKRKMPERVFEDDECVICHLELERPHVLHCGHMYCRDCIFPWLVQRQKSCPICRASVTSRPVPKEVYEKQKNEEVEEVEEVQREENNGINEYRVGKVVEMVGDSSESDKFIIFSSYSDILKCIGKRLKEKGIRVAYFTSQNDGQEVLRMFDQDHQFKVLLLNVRLTNSGLNLTAANHVVFIEPPVNSTHAEQAVGRASRHGQTRDVRVTTFQDPDVGY